jgi:hypothetical protein
MKLFKISIIALVLTCSMQLAKAQVRVGIGINLGTPVRYVERPYYYDDYDRVVYYNRPVRRYYGRPVYYNRPVYRHVVYREHGFRGRGWGNGHGGGRGHGRH